MKFAQCLQEKTANSIRHRGSKFSNKSQVNMARKFTNIRPYISVKRSDWPAE